MSPCLFQNKGVIETMTLTIEVYGNCYDCHIHLLHSLKIHNSATKVSGYVPWIFIKLLSL